MFLRLLNGINLAAIYIFQNCVDRGPAGGKCLLNQKESIITLTASNKSLIRWGDGESTILLGGDVFFQNNSLTLFRKFIKLVRGYNNNSPYLMAMPNNYLNSSKSELYSINKYRTWVKTRYVFQLLFPKSEIYLDSFIFREDSELSNEEIKALWRNEGTIIFVHSNYKYYYDFSAINPDKEVHYVPVYSANADILCDQVIREVIKLSGSASSNGKKVCALISAGPAGKIMVVRLAEAGVRALDMGHYFDYKFYGLKRGKK